MTSSGTIWKTWEKDGDRYIGPTDVNEPRKRLPAGEIYDEDDAEMLCNALNLITFMQVHLPETYTQVEAFYQSYEQARTSPLGGACSDCLLVAGVETVDDTSNE